MNKKLVRLAALGMTGLMSLSSVLGVAAAGTGYSTTIGGEKTTTMDKYLVMEAGAEVPNVDFSFTIGPGQALPATDSTVAILQGIGNPTIKWTDTDDVTVDDPTASFKLGDTVYTSLQTGDYVKGDLTGKQYAKAVGTIDFTGVQFTEPGIYRYVITETASANLPGITDDAASTRVLDVYVEDDTQSDGTKQLKIAGYVLHATASTIDAGANKGSDGNPSSSATDNTKGQASSDYKSQGYTNEYTTYDLEFSKTVTGNQASRDKYFKFTLKISDAGALNEYAVSLDNADASPQANAATKYDSMSNPATITTLANGSAEATFYLQHGQKIVVKNLPAGAKYELVEDPEDYKGTADISGADADAAKDGENALLVKDSITGLEADAVIAYTNERTGTVPTGVMLAVAPFAGLVAAGAVGMFAIGKKKKKEDDAE